MNDIRMLKWSIAESGATTAKSLRATAVVVLGLLSAAAAVVAARAMAGALQSPLEPIALLTVGVLTATAGVAVRLGWLLPLAANRINRLDITVMLVATLAVTALCGGVCSPHDTPLSTALLLRVLIVVEEGCAWLWFLGKWERNASRSATGSSRSAASATKTPDPSIAAPAAEVTQQLTRTETADGVEELSGWLRLPFAVGQRTGSVHVAFCPPLRVTPELQVQQIDGPEARIKTAQLLPFGARFDLKLAAATEEPTTVLLQFAARTPRGRAHSPAGA
jgi:hypothetical protein